MPGVLDAAALADRDDSTVAAELARAAGELLLDVRAQATGLTGRALGDEGDRRSHARLMEWLAAARPDDAVLSEEGADDRRRLQASRVWIVDPLDGTREFSEGRDDWAVHVALWHDGALVAGAVALPGQGVTLHTGAGGVPADHPPGARLRMLVSRTRAPAVATRAAETLGAELVPMGSAGAKVAGVVQGRAEMYVHAGGQYEWDSAAPVAVARAAGLHASRLDGSPLRYNQPDPTLPDLVVCRPELAEAVLAAVAAAPGG